MRAIGQVEDEVTVTGDHTLDGSEQLYIRQLHRPEVGLRNGVPGFRQSLSVDR